MVERIRDPKGRLRKIHYIPNIDGFGARACVRAGLFRKERQYAAGEHVVDNLARRLAKHGWTLMDERGE